MFFSIARWTYSRLRPAALLVIAMLLVLWAAGAFAAGPLSDLDADTDTLPVSINAVSLDYDKKNNLLVAEGDVEIVQGSRLLKADYVKMNLVSKDTVARGNVELFEGDDKLYCDAFNINLDTQLGEVQHASIFLSQQNFYIQGDQVERLGIDSYTIRQGTITTCSGDSPMWKISARTIDMTIEGYARVRGSTFRIKGLPLLYFPYAIFPVKTKRQTGLLYPEIRQSRSDGLQLGNSFFWAISDNTDATFWLDAATKKGLGEGLEYRFKLKERTWGKVYGYFARENDRFFDQEYSDQRDRDQTRLYLDFEGEHYFSDSFYVKAQGSYISDRELYGDYRREVRRSMGQTDKSTIRTLEKDESTLFFTKTGDYSNLVLNVNTYKNLMRHDPGAVQRLPQLAFSTMRRPLAGSPLFYQFDAAYDFFWREEGVKGHRISLFPQVSLPLLYNDWLKFVPEIGVRGLSYVGLNHDRDFDKEGLVPTARAELSTVFMKVFETDFKTIKKIKHTVEPGILYEFIPSHDQRDMPEFDIQEQFYRRHSIGYYVKNRLTALYQDDAGELSESEIGYFLIGQFYNISDPEGGLYLKGDPDDDFSDIFAELRMTLLPSLYVKAKMSYDPYENNLHFYNTLVNWSTRRGDSVELEYRYYRDRFEVLDAKATVRLTRFLYAFLDARYDSFDNQDVDTETGLDFRAQCWGGKFSIETSGGRGGRASDTSINAMLYLKGLGNDTRR